MFGIYAMKISIMYLAEPGKVEGYKVSIWDTVDFTFENTLLG